MSVANPGDASVFSEWRKGKAANYAGGMSLQEALKQNAAAGNIKIVAYPDTNSLLVKGTAEQVHFIEMLVKALDVAKRHVELSLWIVDLNKSDLERLGTSWSGSITIGDKLGVSLNQSSISTLDGSRFIAAVNALEEKKQATVVSRPVLLTQENVPAIFDNNRTFYTKLIGERNVALEHVTYGTMIRVLPRFSADGQIEMSLDIEDGNDKTPQSDTTTSVDALPEVGRTLISTIARVPHGKSLLVGGYTRDANTDTVQSIPFLGKLPLIGSLFRYSSKNKSNVVRVFMIEPKEIVDPLTPDASESVNNILKQSGAGVGTISYRNGFVFIWIEVRRQLNDSGSTSGISFSRILSGRHLIRMQPSILMRNRRKYNRPQRIRLRSGSTKICPVDGRNVSGAGAIS